MRLFRPFLTAIIVFLGAQGVSAAQSAEAVGCDVPPAFRKAAYGEPMTFAKVGSRGNAAEATWIMAVGRIERTTPERFANFLATVENRRSRVIMHSPGGHLLAGLELGLLIRKAGLSTQVGHTIKLDMEEDYPCRTLETHVDDGICASACAYAFLGGVAREFSSPFHTTPNSMLGFHQFYGGLDIEGLRRVGVDAAAARTMSETQSYVGYIASYLQELDMDPGIIELASFAGPDEMNYPPVETLTELGVITPETYGAWFLEPFNDGLVAASREFSPITAAQQITAYCRAETGEAVLMLTSDFSPKNVTAFLEPTVRPGNARESPYSGTIVIDGAEVTIPGTHVAVASSGDLVFIRIAIPRNIATALSRARDLSVTYDAPHSDGYQSGSSALTEKDRKSIGLAFRNCV